MRAFGQARACAEPESGSRWAPLLTVALVTAHLQPGRLGLKSPLHMSPHLLI